MHDANGIPLEMNPAGPAPEKLLNLKSTVKRPISRFFVSVFEKPIEKALSIEALNNVYRRISAETADAFFRNCLNILDVRYAVSDADRRKIPTGGPLAVLANHPFGGLEGVILGDLLTSVRPDVKILGNFLLQQIPEISPWIIPVDPFGRKSACRYNMAGLKEAVRWLRAGGALIVFPSGEVSSLNFKQGQVVDPPWSPHAGFMIRKTGAAALPVFFPGRNSSLFQLVGLVHPLLRTALLPKELIRKRRKEVDLYIGRAVSHDRMKKCRTDAEAAAYLRAATYFLKHRRMRRPPSVFPKDFLPGRRPPEPIIAPVRPSRLQKEVNRLPDDQLLTRHGGLTVFYARAAQIPELMNEIGRLRETVFRQAGEGTGACIDLDRFDAHYLHLFLWGEDSREVAGAYRLGLVDDVLNRFGPGGLYASAFFNFRPEFLPRLGAAVEIGRSFIAPAYQKKYNSLLLLWKGIGEFISRHPEYKTLFGLVSISRNYQQMSWNLMVEFLRRNRFNPDLSRLVSARTPYRRRPHRNMELDVLCPPGIDIEDVSQLVSDIEQDGKGVPVLLRQYLKLNAELIGFNVDRSFSSVLDGLIKVDLTRADPRVVTRFMGAEGYRRFAARHGLDAVQGPVSCGQGSVTRGR